MATATIDDDAISLRELFLLFWREKLFIVSAVLVCAVLAGVTAILQKDKYKATIVISPVSNDSGAGRLGAGGSQMGGLASLIGISVGGDSRKAESLAVLQSEALTERYIRENDLMPVLFPEKWDAAGKRWLDTNPKTQPTLWKANKTFEDIRAVTEDRKSGLVTLSITWSDPAIAARWANDLVKLANDYLRAKAIQESEKHIAYLNEQAQLTDVAQLRLAIYAVLESEIKNVMLAKGPGDYALKVIDPAVPPELKSGPKRALWVLVGAFAGLVLSLFALFIRNAWRTDYSPT